MNGILKRAESTLTLIYSQSDGGVNSDGLGKSRRVDSVSAEEPSALFFLIKGKLLYLSRPVPDSKRPGRLAKRILKTKKDKQMQGRVNTPTDQLAEKYALSDDK